jgi:NAD dependent epimerase/dehydratase
VNWKGCKVLVTGAGGFIGSHLVETLVELGANVRAFVRYNSRGEIGLLRFLPKDILQDIEIVAGDLRDSHAVSDAVNSRQVVFHLGALIGIPYSYQNPGDAVATNLFGTLNVLTASRQDSIEKVIHTSTSEVYGTAQVIPITESHPLQGQSPYSASKIGADKIAESFFRSYNLPVCTIRPFNTYGPRQSDRAVIPTIVSQALRNNELRLGALWPRRDYTFVKDTVMGFIKAAASAKGLGMEVNLGSGQDITIGDLAEKILSLLGKSMPIIEDSQRIRPEQSEVGRLHSDFSRAHQLFGWEPTVSLDEGLNEVIKWVEQHQDLYEPSVYRV